jgi:hypothetical protein
MEPSKWSISESLKTLGGDDDKHIIYSEWRGLVSRGWGFGTQIVLFREKPDEEGQSISE